MNPYVWLDLSAERCPGTSSSIAFIGKECDCIEWVRNATYKKNIRKKLLYELREGFWFKFRPSEVKCRLSAGEGATRIERTFIIKFENR